MLLLFLFPLLWWFMQRSEMANLQEELGEAKAAHKRELAKKETEKEIILDDLEGLNDQYQQLNMAFETQRRELATAKVHTNGTLPYPTLC